MSARFQQRGYPSKILLSKDNTHKSASTIPIKRIPFVHKYHPYAPKIAQTLKKHWNILGKAYPDIEEFSTPPLMCYKRDKNIRDHLVRADIGSLQHSTRQSFLATPRKGTFPCLGCAHCSSVSKGEYFTHPHTGKRYPINGFYTCNSNFVVYIIRCPCGLLYVGETTQRVKDRISKHKSTIRCENLLLPIPAHFKSAKQSIAQLRFQVVEQVPLPRRGGNRVTLLKKRESYWIHELKTIQPFGLNREYDRAYDL